MAVRPLAAASALFAAGAFFGISFPLGGLGWQWALVAATASAALLARRRRGIGWLLCALALGLFRGAIIAPPAIDPILAGAPEPLLIEARVLSSERGNPRTRSRRCHFDPLLVTLDSIEEFVSRPVLTLNGPPPTRGSLDVT